MLCEATRAEWAVSKRRGPFRNHKLSGNDSDVKQICGQAVKQGLMMVIPHHKDTKGAAKNGGPIRDEIFSVAVIAVDADR